MKDVIKKVPIPLCGVMLGAAALGNLLQSYSEGIRYVCGIFAAFLLILVLLKLIMFPGAVKEDMGNPIMASVSGTFPMALMILGYTAVMWSIIIIAPKTLIGIFSSDTTLMKDAVPALKQYFAAFICMDMQYIGQTVFKSLNKKKQAIFFSLLRKVFIVVPLTYLMPYALHMGTDGVFLAEPVSNVIGGGLCFITMLLTVLPELKRMERKNALYETGTIL